MPDQSAAPAPCHLRPHAAGIRHPILVLSGKGGVGKSTVAVQLARGLARRGARTGLLDADLHGPSVPRLLGLAGQRHAQAGDRLLPVAAGERLAAVSVGFLVDDADTPVIWRGPAKTGAIRRLALETDWGQAGLDALVVDLPPGTGDEALAAAQLIPGVAGAVVVTTPQALATDDVRRSLAFCDHLRIPILGLVENYAGYACPTCGQISDPFHRGGGERLAQARGVPLLARLPIDPRLMEAGDRGADPVLLAPDAPAAAALDRLPEALAARLPGLLPTALAAAAGAP